MKFKERWSLDLGGGEVGRKRAVEFMSSKVSRVARVCIMGRLGIVCTSPSVLSTLCLHGKYASFHAVE